MYPWQETLMGIGLAAAIVIGAIAACGTRVLVDCRLAAVKFLPQDPGQITPYDVQDLVGRLKACRESGDAQP